MNFRSIAFVLFLASTGCESPRLFVWRYYRAAGGETFEFFDDFSYNYSRKSEGGYINQHNRGTWLQRGKKVFIHDGISDVGSLPIRIKKTLPNTTVSFLVVNINPPRIPTIPNLPNPLEKLNIELFVDDIVYNIQAETEVFQLDNNSKNVYLRAYPKVGVERNFNLLNDTLTSEVIPINSSPSVYTLEVDCDLANFAQIKLGDDTIRIVNDRTIKWKGLKLWR